MDSSNDSQATPLTPEEWDATRKRFMNSMMVNTEIFKLAQNIDAHWPVRSKDEVPLKYVPLTYEELMQMPGFAEKPDRARLLVDILNETMAFDDPFGEMAEYVDSSSRKDESALNTMRALEIPEEFPLDFCNISEETQRFCEDEEIQTVGGFLEFAQNMAQNVVVGGDFRSFLNSFAHRDEKSIARYVPTRIGSSGVHLAETIGLIIARLPKPAYLAVVEDFGGEPTAEDRKEVRVLNPQQRREVKSELMAKAKRVFDYFDDETETLRDRVAEGSGAVERFFMPLDHPNREKVCQVIAMRTLGDSEEPETEEKRGFFSRLFGRKG